MSIGPSTIIGSQPKKIIDKFLISSFQNYEIQDRIRKRSISLLYSFLSINCYIYCDINDFAFKNNLPYLMV